MKYLFAFDCFGVVLSEIAPFFFEKRLKREEAAIIKDKFFVPADRGDYSLEEVLKLLADYFHEDYDLITKEWYDLVNIQHEVVEFVKKLKVNYPESDVILISNAPKGLVEYLFDDYLKAANLNDLFVRKFVSHHYHLSKPSIEFYKKCLEEMNGKYTKMFMVDDNLNNLKCLDEINIIGLRYENINKLEEDFKKHGILK